LSIRDVGGGGPKIVYDNRDSHGGSGGRNVKGGVCGDIGSESPGDLDAADGGGSSRSLVGAGISVVESNVADGGVKVCDLFAPPRMID
jgi:hypothetical protein